MTDLMNFEDIPLDKPSMLIRVGLADLAKVEAMPEVYRVDMSFWHAPLGSFCYVCLAGAVMAMSLNALPDRYYRTDKVGDEVQRRLFALDDFQQGHVPDALYRLKILSKIRRPQRREITPYHVSPALFRRDMERLASDLEGAGL